MLDTTKSEIEAICKKESLGQKFKRFNERPVEYAFVFNKMAELYPRAILDVGTGTTALPHLIRHCGALVTATDNVRDYWTEGMFNRHYYVIDDDIRDTQLEDKYDMVICVSVLEHIEQSDQAVRGLFSLLAPGGSLILTFPYTEGGYVRNVYVLPGSSYGQEAQYITQSFCRRDIERWLNENDGVIVDQQYWRFWTGEHWTVGEQIIPPQRVTAEERHQVTCLLLRKSESTITQRKLAENANPLPG